MPETKLLYCFMKAKHALQNIECHRLKFSNLDHVNDPYESLPIRFNDCEEENCFFNARKDLIQKKTRVICFSGTYCDPTLWGHYANNCKGICLGFDVICEEGRENKYAKRVRYVKERVDISHIGFNYKNDHLEPFDPFKFFNLFLTKSHRWKNEKEWRICNNITDQQRDPAPEHYFFPFDNVLELREILIGFRCPNKEDVKSRLDGLVTQSQYSPKPDIFFTQRSLSAFEIEKVT